MNDLTPSAGSDPQPGRISWGPLIVGGILVINGTLLLMAETMGFPFHQAIRHFWPVIMIAIGLAKIASPRPDGQPTGGYMLTMAGGILLMHTLHIWTLRTSWPLFVVAAGINIIAGAFMQARMTRGPRHAR